MTTVLLDDGRRIDYFDNLLPLTVRTQIYAKCAGSNFKIGWEDMGLLERGSYDYHLHSQWPDEVIGSTGIFNHLEQNEEVMEIIGDKKLFGTYVNLTYFGEAHFVHHDQQSSKTMLYYVNPEWNDGWGGETMFWTEDMKDVVFTSPYTPGRIVIFDGDIPHSIRPQSSLGPKFRFSLAMMLRGQNNG